MCPTSTLTPPQDHALALISTGSTICAAAQSAGVHRNTVHNWIASQPHFRLALASARESLALSRREEAEQLAPAAIDTIRSLMTDPSTPADVRLKAALSLLRLATAPPPEPAAAPGATSVQAPQPPLPPQTVPNSAQSISEPPALQTPHKPPACPINPPAAPSSPPGHERDAQKPS